MASYATRVARDIHRWRETGLIDEATASALSSDVERNSGGGFSFGSVLAMMAAALLGAAILIFIAANWEIMPRLLRVLMLFALIFGGYLGGVLLKLRGHEGFGEAAYVVGAVAFGASLALISQMYHLTGDETQAILTWTAGTALAAAGLRSPALNAGAVMLAVGWTMMMVFDRWAGGAPLSYLAIAAILYALSFWTGSVPARHLVLLSIPLVVVMSHIDHQSLNPAILLMLAAAALFLTAWPRPDEVRRYAGLGNAALADALIGFLVGIGIVQITLIDEPEFLVASIVALAGVIGALLLAGRRSRELRWVAYAAFVVQLGFVYLVMIGSMLDTAGFFVAAGLFLAVLAWLIARLERRFGQAEPAMESAA